jgi:Potential Queuosine, Q, salvage protein family
MEIVEALPGFRDMALVNDEPVYIFKKVQLLTMDLYKRFSSSNPELFAFYDIQDLTLFADNVIPTILHHLNIIPLTVPDDATSRQKKLITELKEDLRTGRETTMERSYILRAVAVDACEIVVRTAREMEGFCGLKEMTAEQLDAYFWQIGKVGDMREIIRFCDPNTVFF